MKKLSMLCALLLAFCMSALAQTSTPSSSQSGSMSGDQNSSMKQDKDNMKMDKMGKKTSLKGCISQMNGKYMLTDKKHPNGVELMSDQDLSAHVGHEVQVKGMWEKSDMSSGGMSSDNSSASSASSSNSSMSGGQMDHEMGAIKVTDLKMVSDHCSMNQGMDKDKDMKK
ncbi:MAG TPA: hypothetical protein VJN64_00830 [Terriglobales bacterium]|nr:hypothetical protein [Terriglobales bacterium]